MVARIHKDKPIYVLTKSHTTKSGTTYDSNTWVWVHLWHTDTHGRKAPPIGEPLASVSPYNRKIGLPKNITFRIPHDKLKPLTDTESAA